MQLTKRLIYLNLLSITFISLSIGCSRYKVSKTVKSSIGQTITYPNEILCVEGADKHYAPLADPIMTLLVWFDSTECSSCKIRGISTFQGLMSYCRDTLGSVDIKFLFSPLIDNIEYIVEASSDLSVDYPIYIDVENKFKEFNSFIPDHFNYHSFLLNKEGGIELIGNPLINEKINQLYRRTMKSYLVDHQ